ESGCLRLQPKEGGKPHLRLNTTTRPIANMYREGKLQKNFEERIQEGVKPLKWKRIKLTKLIIFNRSI
ncbi:unnamed protein product, partial [Onchocerca ochengi]